MTLTIWLLDIIKNHSNPLYTTLIRLPHGPLMLGDTHIHVFPLELHRSIYPITPRHVEFL